jgi:hypothetical protein
MPDEKHSSAAAATQPGDHTPLLPEHPEDHAHNPRPELVGVTADLSRVVDADSPEAAVTVNLDIPIPKMYQHLFTEKGNVRERARGEGIPHPSVVAAEEAEREAQRAVREGAPRALGEGAREETRRAIDITGTDEEKKPSKR